jgi:thiol-disulfide isomerase/thioredoxin
MKDTFFNGMKNSKIVRKSVIIIMMSLTIFSCKESNSEFEIAKNKFEVVIKTLAKTDSLYMGPSFVSEKFLDSTYTMFFKGRNENGIVNFKGNKPPHPVMFDIFDENVGLSDKFFIDNGSTELLVSFVNEDKKVIISDNKTSKTQKEYELLKKQGLDSIENLRSKANSVEERRKFSVIRDTLIVDFIKENPNSYVPLWLIANYFSFQSQQYNKLYDESMPLFSNEIKKTKLFKNVEASLKEGRTFSFQNKELPLKNMELEDVQFKLSGLNNRKYILLDFWYSNCGPCLQEMPKYIPIYEKYKDLGFEIVSISVDKTSKIEDWRTTINEKGFNWIHYLDENGVEAKKMNISSFPTTFLVNNEGAIIEKEIRSEKLKNFLSSKLD